MFLRPPNLILGERTLKSHPGSHVRGRRLGAEDAFPGVAEAPFVGIPSRFTGFLLRANLVAGPNDSPGSLDGDVLVDNLLIVHLFRANERQGVIIIISLGGCPGRTDTFSSGVALIIYALTDYICAY